MVVITDNGSKMEAAFWKYVTRDDDEEEDEKEEEFDDPESGFDVDKFDDWEMEHDITFITMKRISCFVHTFNLLYKSSMT